MIFNLKFIFPVKYKYLFLVISLLFNSNNLVFAQNLNPAKNNLVCQSNLNWKINEIINQPTTEKATWGIVIKEINAPNNIYELNGDKLLIPASNMKLLITAESLLRWGKNWEIKTPVYLTKNKLFNSYDLTIIGKGDPTIKNEHLETLVQELSKLNIKTIENLTVVDGYLPPPVINYSWEYSDIYYYFAVPVNSLILNENTVNLTVTSTNINQPVNIQWQDEIAGQQWDLKNEAITGNQESENIVDILTVFTTSILNLTGNLPINNNPREFRLAIPQPESYFLDSLEKQLNSQGIRVNKKQVIYDNNYQNVIINLPNSDLFFEFTSLPLNEIITIINQDSNNLFSEVLLKYLFRENETLSSLDQSGENIENFLIKLNISEDDYKVKDGSGLSRHNLITPLASVSILEQMSKSEYQDTFLNSFAIAGKTGTLKNRLQDTTVTEKFYGKTGTLTGVVSLSGYLVRENKPDLIISIIVNNSTEKSTIIREVVDKIILLVATANDEC